jgi:hypothetical protein
MPILNAEVAEIPQFIDKRSNPPQARHSAAEKLCSFCDLRVQE